MFCVTEGYHHHCVVYWAGIVQNIASVEMFPNSYILHYLLSVTFDIFSLEVAFDMLFPRSCIYILFLGVAFIFFS